MRKEEIKASIARTWEAEAQSILSLLINLDLDVICEAVNVLVGMKGKAVVSGCGTSGAAAKKIAHTLCCVERPAFFLSPADGVHGALGALQKEDILILISKGGNTEEIISLIPACRSKGAYMIGISENKNSILAQHANLFIQVSVVPEPCPFNMLATASTMAIIAVFDAICIAIMHETGYTKEQFACIHPGGAVGRRLQQGEAE